MGDALDKGQELELRIEKFFSINGYTTRRNWVTTGRSGGRHEIDVYAEKGDGVTTFRVAVECKAWNHPIAKETVAKLSYVMNDLGISKGIVVSLAGTSLGAEQSGSNLGIELWGPHDLEQKLGQVALADLRAGPAARIAKAMSLGVDPLHAKAVIDKQSRGRLGMGRERILGVSLVWVPVYLVELHATGQQKGFLSRGKSTTIRYWNTYEALTGSLVETDTQPPLVGDADIGVTIPAAIQDAKLVAQIRTACEKYRQVVQASARQRWAAQLQALGVPTGVACSVEATELIFRPYYAGFLSRKGMERVCAVDGVSGEHSSTLTSVLTQRIGYLQEALSRTFA